MTEPAFYATIGFSISGAIAAALITIAVQVRGCNVSTTEVQEKSLVERNAADNATARACIASSRTASECAIIIRGTR